MGRKLLFIENDEDMLKSLREWFGAKNYTCECARNGLAGLDLALRNDFECIVLDLTLPDISGLEVWHKLSQAGRAVPVILLTDQDGAADKITGLQNGADDYLAKPFAMQELEKRIDALSRPAKPSPAKISFGPVDIDIQEQRAFRSGQELQLAPDAFKMLELLVRAAPGIVSQETLTDLLWGGALPHRAALRNAVYELRKVLDKPFPINVLETVPHLGWRLRLPTTKTR